MSDGPDFTSGACPASTTLAWGRNAGSTLFCGRGDGHEGNHHFGVEWNEPAAKGWAVVCPGCQPGAGRFAMHTLIRGCSFAPGSTEREER